MSELYLMTTIIDRKQLPRCIALYQEKQILVNCITLGRGTVPPQGAARFLGSAEKAVCFALVTPEAWRGAKRALRQGLQIDVPGVGIAFTVPLSSIGGRRELAFLTEGQGFTRGEESVMRGTEREMTCIFCRLGYV